MCLAVPGQILEVREEQGTRMATIDFDGIRKEICLAYLPDAAVGDYCIVHVGFAISRIDEASALETLQMFKELGILDDELGLEIASMASDWEAVRHEVPRRVQRSRAGAVAVRRDRPDHHQAVGDHGGLRRPDPLDHPQRHRPAACRDMVELIHGPGCPVCVTPLGVIDKALEIAARPDVILCSFGDMLRVPGSDRDLFQVKSEGGDVRVVYSPLDAVKLAAEQPGPRGRLLRDRLRDHRAGERHGRPPGQATRV